MKTKRKGLAAFLLSLCMMIATAAPVFADEETDRINNARNGVLCVQLLYVDDSGNEFLIQNGTGFLISEQTLLTCDHVIRMDDVTKAAASEILGVDFNDPKVNLEIRVVVQRDVTIEATVENANRSEEMDFAVLDLSETIVGKEPLILGDSEALEETERVYALGFPALDQYVQDFTYYTQEDQSVTSGIVGRKMDIDGVPYIKHTAQVREGNSGGPLLNADGEVVGINNMYASDPANAEAGSDSYAIEINEIREVLDARGIAYNGAGGEEAPTPAAPDNPDGENDENTVVNKSELNADLQEAKSISAEAYTEESYNALQDQIAEAESVSGDANASQETVDAVRAGLRDAMADLEEARQTGLGIWLYVIIGVAAAVVVAVIVVIAVMSSKKKKREERERRMKRERISSVPPISGGRSMGEGMPPQTPVSMQDNHHLHSPGAAGSANNAGRQMPPVQTPPLQPGGGFSGSQNPRNVTPFQQMPATDSPETTLLGEGSEGTTVLGAGTAGGAILIRKKTQEKIVVNSAVFTIGKERSKVNYCITGNTSISRTHAQITRRGADYYITDMNSTNCTFVNNVKVAPGQTVMLKEGAVVRMADEEFEFHLG
mgnify:CR=1 FL=1